MNNIDSVLNQLKDIKPNVAIPDSSLYYLLAIIAALIAILALGAFFFYKAWAKKQRRLKKSSRYKGLEALKNIDYSQTKEAVYNFSKYAQMLASNEQKEELSKILQELQKYKFKKEIEPLEPKDKKAMQDFIKKLKV